MNVLAFDTTFGATSVAVRWRNARGEWMLREAYEARTASTGGLDGAKGHAERLLPMIEGVLADSGVRLDDVDRLAVTLGPGTFTGVRVGLATARAFRLAKAIPIVGLDTLTVMSLRATLLLAKTSPLEPIDRPLVVAVDARRGDVYCAAFTAGGDRVLLPPALLSIAAAAAQLAAWDNPLVVGSGGPLIAALLDATTRASFTLPDLEPHARSLAQCAHLLPERDAVEPLYLRAADAKPPSQSSILRPN